MNRKILIACLISSMAVACVKDPQTPGADEEPGAAVEVAEDSVLKGWVRIKLQDDASALRTGVFTRGAPSSGNSALDELAASLGATEIRRSFGEGGKFAERRRRYGFHLWYDIRFDEERPVSRAASDISMLPGVAHAQPIYKIRLMDSGAAVPAETIYVPAESRAMRASQAPFDDPYLDLQWHYNNDGTLQRSVEGADLNLYEAWKTEAGNPAVTVAITDGGIDVEHPDLAANIWINEAELNGVPGVDDDGNGYVDDVYGWNCMKESGQIVPSSHGTHVAGTVGAVNNNGIGVCGVAGGTGMGDGVRFMACQILDSEQSGKTAEAYLYAAENGAVISQNSWVYDDLGFKLPLDMSEAFDYFIETAGNDPDGNQTGPMKGGILIFAAGNANQSTVKMPAADPRTIAVTAMAPDYTKAGYSNYGDAADIYAPGGSASTDASYPEVCRVYSTDMGGRYGYMSGTSMACPHVSGVAALIVSHYGVGRMGFTPNELKKIMLRSYRPVGSYVGDKYANKLGVGLLDAGMIFTEDPQSSPGVIISPETVSAQNTVWLSWAVPSDGNDQPAATFEVVYTGCGTGKFEGRPDIEGKEVFPNYFEKGERVTYSMVLPYNHDYTFGVTAADRFGNRSQTVSFTQAVGDYQNEKPRPTERFGNIEVESAGEEHTLEFDLSERFTDPNLPDGDVLTYTFKNFNEDIVKVGLAGARLTIEPLAKGNATVSVYAADLDGQRAQSDMTVIVKNGGNPAPPVVETGGRSIFPNPADDYIDISWNEKAGKSAEVRVYDSGQRVAASLEAQFDARNIARIDVAALAPGIYTLVVKSEGDKWSAAFLKK